MNLKNIAQRVFNIFSIVAATTIAAAQPVYAQQVEWSGVCVGTGEGADVPTIQGLECLIANVFTVIITLIGLTAFVMFIVGSLTWLTAGTNSSNLEKARKSFTFAIVGLVVALSAFIIINLIASFTGVNIIRNFAIPTSDRGF